MKFPIDGLDSWGNDAGNAAELLAGVLDSAMDAIITVDEQQRIVLYNRAAEEVFGWPRQAVLLQPLEKLIPDRFRQTHAQQINQYGNTGVTSRSMGKRTAVKGLRANGEEFPLDASISRLDTPGGKLFTVILRDITEVDRLQRELAENDARLRESQRRLLVAQRLARIGYWQIDLSTNLMWWCDEAYNVLGVDRARLDGTYDGLLQLIHPGDREAFEVECDAAVPAGLPLDIEFRVVASAGEVRWVHLLGRVEGKAHGKPITLAGTVQDITDRKLSDDARRTSEAQFHLLTDAMPQIVWMMQPDGRHTYFNQKWMDYTGLAMEESLGHGWTHLIHPDDSLRASKLWEQAFKSGEVYEIEYRLRRADGVYRWMLGRALPLCDATGQRTKWLGTLTDIDDLKQATALLEKNHSMIRIAGKVARLGGWTIELPDRTLTWSDENCIIHDVPPGYKPTLEEGIGYFLPEHRATVIRYVEACAQQGTPYEFVLPKVTAKGRRIWVRSIGEAVRDAAGQIIRLQGAFQDISEQKQAEARMLALETQLTTTLESITDGFYLLDKDWKFTFLNGQAERMLKRRREDLLGKNLWKEFPEAVGTSVEREYRLTGEEQRTSHFEAFDLPLETWFDFHVYPTETGIAVYFQDITQRRSEQAQLRLLETAVSRLNDIVIITEAEPFDEPGPRIVFVNDAFERYTGYSREDAIGNTPGLLTGPNTQRAELDRIRAAMKNWQPVRSEIVSYTKAGKELWLETDIAPIADESGRFTHWVAVERDITERRRQQEEILSLNSELEERVQLRTSQLEAAITELEAFSYSVAHDLRSPLITIGGFSALLQEALPSDSGERSRHYLTRIRNGVRRMGELTDGLLSLAHLSRTSLTLSTVDMSAEATTVIQQCSENDPARVVQVTVEPGLLVRADPSLLRQVLENLIANAWKFTSKTSYAEISMGQETGPDHELVYFVKDNGAGFNMAYADKLFGTFQRLHSPEEFSGSGIGLATVQRIINRHGGKIWASSGVDQGSTFYFTLGSETNSADATVPS